MKSWFGTNISCLEIIIAASGLILYLATLRILLRLKEFTRTDEDNVWLAANNIRLGKFTTALEFIRNIKITSPESQQLQIAALLGVNHLDEAIEKAKLFELDLLNMEAPIASLTFYLIFAPFRRSENM